MGRMAELLERMVKQNDQIIELLRELSSGMSSLSSSVEDKADDIQQVMESVRDELDWTKPYGTAKNLMEKLSDIETSLGG